MKQAVEPSLERRNANHADAVECLLLWQSCASRRAQVGQRCAIEGDDGDVMAALNEPFGYRLQQSLGAADEWRVGRRDVDNAERTRRLWAM